MLPLLFLFFASASQSAVLIDDDVDLGPGDWRLVRLQINERPAIISAKADLKSKGSPVRVALVKTEDLREYRLHGDEVAMTKSAYGPTASIRYSIHRPGQYAVIVDVGEFTTRTAVHLTIEEQFRADLDARLAPEKRRQTAFLLSFAWLVAAAAIGLPRVVASFRHKRQ